MPTEKPQVNFLPWHDEINNDMINCMRYAAVLWCQGKVYLMDLQFKEQMEDF